MAEQPAFGRNWLRWGALGAVAIAAVAIYVSLDAQSNTADAACAAATERSAGLDEHAIGQVAAFRVVANSASLTDIAFQTPGGEPRTLADFTGKVVLLNLWATWCAPCREEMPALDALEATLGGDAFQVLPVSIDTVNTPAGPQEFFADFAIGELELYVDPSARMLADLRRIGIRGGLPTTILIDENGCTLGIVEGPADWAGLDAMALIGAAIGG
jgi:thiol-disulfide isomerase/thioredoxin